MNEEERKKKIRENIDKGILGKNTGEMVLTIKSRRHKW